MAQMVNYVKFIRGTSAAFAKLNVKDNNTLYFISEKGSETGELYLGSKLIAGSSTVAASSLGELKDVLLDVGITDGDVLAYDAIQEKWVNKSLEEVVVQIMQGATSEQDGQSGLVPAPLAGQEGYFLRGDGSWAAIPTDAEVNDLVKKVNTIIGADAGKSMREVAVEEVATVVAGAPEAFDTLQEIAAWIESHPDDIAAINAAIKKNEQDIAELQGLVAVNTQNISTNSNSIKALQQSVGKLETNITSLQEADTQIKQDITLLNERLTWSELVEA